MERKIPRKNYVILLVVAILFVLLVFYMRNWYNTTKIYYNGGSLILDVSTQINKEEIGNYALENPNFVLYVSSGYDDSSKKFEKELKNYIVKNHINNIVYLNADASFNETLKNYAVNSKIEKQIKSDGNISIYYFENGKISRAITNAEKAGAKDVEKKFKKYGVVDNG